MHKYKIYPPYLPSFILYVYPSCSHWYGLLDRTSFDFLSLRCFKVYVECPKVFHPGISHIHTHTLTHTHTHTHTRHTLIRFTSLYYLLFLYIVLLPYYSTAYCAICYTIFKQMHSMLFNII
jgi:hypothetical protein